MTEHEIQNQIMRTFATRADMRLWRANTGAAKIGNALVRFGIPGQADLSGLLANGRRFEIEVKNETGRQSPDQKNFQAMIEKFGGLYVLARSVDDVWAALRAAGWGEL